MNEGRSTRTQCNGIVRWYCNGAAGRKDYAGVRVTEVFCKNLTGHITYCRQQDDHTGINNCESQSSLPNGCVGYAPECRTAISSSTLWSPGNGNPSWLDCTDGSLGGQTDPGRTTYVDSAGRQNCLHKYGILYQDFVGTCMANYRQINGNDESVQTRIRPCYLDSSIAPYRSLFENVVDIDIHPGINWQCAACGSDHTPGTPSYDQCLIDCQAGHALASYLPAYSDGYLGNRNNHFLDPVTGATGVAPDNWGYGENFYSSLPYWQHCNTMLNSNAWQQSHPRCDMDAEFSAAAFQISNPVAAAAMFEFASPDPPEPSPPSPFLPPPPV